MYLPTGRPTSGRLPHRTYYSPDTPLGENTGLLCGAANPGCSRLSAGSLRLAIRRFLPQETLPKGSSPAHVNASFRGSCGPAPRKRAIRWPEQPALSTRHRQRRNSPPLTPTFPFCPGDPSDYHHGLYRSNYGMLNRNASWRSHSSRPPSSVSACEAVRLLLQWQVRSKGCGLLQKRQVLAIEFRRLLQSYSPGRQPSCDGADDRSLSPSS
jgi:hypothetical protein